ncbi:hypothetical protein ACTFIR_011384 [Dictyostelium discoideum]
MRITEALRGFRFITNIDSSSISSSGSSGGSGSGGSGSGGSSGSSITWAILIIVGGIDGESGAHQKDSFVTVCSKEKVDLLWFIASSVITVIGSTINLSM